ncbi:MAG: septum formation initiator family protein [Tannerellaceae bacterium]|jgi:cell division protein FtsB|nr:septum formation initiator family protein [Tannerellaceae bacterium]
MFHAKEFYNKYLSRLRFNYVAIAAFLIIIITDSESSLINRLRYENTIRSLRHEIIQCRDEIKTNRAKLETLRTNKESLERLAREEYLMKRDNEDLFIIK